MRHTIKIAVMVVAVVAAVMSGIALAQTSDDTTEAPSFQTRVLEQLAPLVDGGVISQDQADAIADTFAEAQAERQQARQERREQRQADKQELLDLLGIEGEALREAFAAGETLADVAETQGVPVQDVIDLMVANAEERIAQAVADGKLTAEEAEEKLAEITEKITDKVNNGGGFGKHGRGGHGPGGRGPGGPGGFGPGGDPPATDPGNA